MSLMLDALQRIEAKQSRRRWRAAAGPASGIGLQPVAESAECIELPAALPADDLPSTSTGNLAPPATASRTVLQHVAELFDLIELSAALPADGLPSTSPEKSLPPEPASGTALQAVAEPFDLIELPPALPAGDLPNMNLEDLALPEPISLEATIDQLQTFICDAGLLYDSELAVEATEFQVVERPAATPSPAASAEVAEPTPVVDAAPVASEVEPEAAPVIDTAPSPVVSIVVAEPTPVVDAPPSPVASAVVAEPTPAIDAPPMPAVPPALVVDAAPSPVTPTVVAESTPVVDATPSPVASAVVAEPTLATDAPPAPALPPAPREEVERDEPAVETAAEASLPEAEPPVIVPVATDPYAATAHAILRQLPRDQTQVLLFTSVADGQGTTMTLARLAPWLAEGIEGKVLVVDANFRNPEMARWLAASPTWLLPDVLAGAADWPAAVQTTSQRRVSVLPGGTDAQGRGADRNLQAMSYLLREVAGHYDLVVVDAPSLVHRGTVQLAAACDATYLIAHLGEGSPRMFHEAAQVVALNGGRLLGCVVIEAE
jgi:Mrp family chromosome partitioning ATPase